MTPEEYAARQAVISATVANFVYQFARFWATAAISPVQWVRLLRFLWPQIQIGREQSAALAREFYDSQRLFYHPELPRAEIPLEGNDFDVFVKNMEPVRKKMSVADSPADAVTKMALQTMREVENAGRRQIINAVKKDQGVAEKVSKNLRDTKKEIAQAGRSKLVRGWARVATGRETCGWCLMLISRGPVYYDSFTAGLDLDSESAMEMIAAGEDVSGYMDEWHTGCDCKVVPVFKTDDWENSPLGRAADRALDLWIEASEEAEREMDRRGTRIHTFGKNKGQEMTFNEEAILALRRRLERGDINPIEYAGLAA